MAEGKSRKEALRCLKRRISDAVLGNLMRGVENIVPTMADARDLPYSDDNFDAAYLTLVLGEIPDQDAALSELGRVLKPGGHLVVGELFPDFHMVPFRTLQKRAEAVGFRFERRLGSALGYFARFRALWLTQAPADLSAGVFLASTFASALNLDVLTPCSRVSGKVDRPDWALRWCETSNLTPRTPVDETRRSPRS